MSVRALFILWSAISVVGGAAGGWVGQHFFGAPFYFGFGIAWVLLGFVGLFVIAAKIENDRLSRTGQK
jgi:hypothetical protein